MFYIIMMSRYVCELTFYGFKQKFFFHLLKKETINQNPRYHPNFYLKMQTSLSQLPVSQSWLNDHESMMKLRVLIWCLLFKYKQTPHQKKNDLQKKKNH